MKLKKQEDRKAWLFRSFGLTGATIWALAILLRPAITVRPKPLDFLLGVAPNFGVVFLLAYFSVWACQKLLHKNFDPKYTPQLCLAILLVLLASELIHYLFLGAGFDHWDMAASAAACLILLLASKAATT